MKENDYQKQIQNSADYSASHMIEFQQNGRVAAAFVDFNNSDSKRSHQKLLKLAFQISGQSFPIIVSYLYISNYISFRLGLTCCPKPSTSRNPMLTYFSNITN